MLGKEDLVLELRRENSNLPAKCQLSWPNASMDQKINRSYQWVMNRKSYDSATMPKRAPCRILRATRWWKSKKISTTKCSCSRSGRRKSANPSKKLCSWPRKSFVKQKKTRPDLSINLNTPKLKFWSIPRVHSPRKLRYQKTRCITSSCRALRWSKHTAKKVLRRHRHKLSWGLVMR